MVCYASLAGIAIFAILAGFVMFLLAPTASASAVSSHSWPNHVIGGGGCAYTDTTVGQPGDCAVAAIGANPIGGGKIQYQAQIISYIGAMAGSAKVTYSGGSRIFDALGTNWISPIETIGGYHNGEHVGITLSSYSVVIGNPSGEECQVPEPAIVVRVSG